MKIKTFIALLALLVSTAASAIELGEAKDKGYVGEQTDGYLGVVQASPEVTRLVDEVNSKRKQKYQQLAKQNDITLEQVEALAGKKAVEKTQSGHYVLVNGDWIKK